MRPNPLKDFDEIVAWSEPSLCLSRKNPYTGSIHSTRDAPFAKLYRLTFPSSNDDCIIKSTEDLNSRLESLVARYPALKIKQSCQKWDKRTIVVELSNVATFHVFLTWMNDSTVKFQRINVVGIAEKVRFVWI